MRSTLALLIFLPAVVTTAASAQGDAAQAIVERAARCWTTPQAMRGIRFAATVDVRVSEDGDVELLKISDVSPPTETAHALAADFAEAVERCGPYGVTGVTITLPLAWPL